MAKFTANPERVDPYRNFKFRVKIGTRYVAGLNKCSSLKKTTEKVDWYESGNPSTPFRLPGKTSYEAITLTAGVTHDTEFEKWANKVWNFGAGLGSEVSLKDFRKDLLIEIYNEAGQLAIAYKVFRCWVSEFQATADLDPAAEVAHHLIFDQVLDPFVDPFVRGHRAVAQRVEHVRERGGAVDARLLGKVRAARDQPVLRGAAELDAIQIEGALSLRWKR